MNPSRRTTTETNLDLAPSAIRPAASSAGPAFRPPRRSGVSAGRVSAFFVLLAAVAAGVWFAFRPGTAAPDAAEPVSDSTGENRPAGGLSDVPDEIRPVLEYLRPSPAEVRLWLDSVLASSYVREKWSGIARNLSLAYGPELDQVNAFAFYDQENGNCPSIALCGGWVRLSRLVGALALVQSSAEAQGVEKDIKAYLQRVSGVVAETGSLSETAVIDLLDEFDVGIGVFQDVGAVSAAKGFADGVCKATLAHEFGHLAAGHPRGADLNQTVSQNEERQADLFASSVAASVANGQQMLGGQILTWYTLALAETINPTNEVFRSHPYSVDRLRAAVDANKALAASMGITPADVESLVAEAASGPSVSGDEPEDAVQAAAVPAAGFESAELKETAEWIDKARPAETNEVFSLSAAPEGVLQAGPVPAKEAAISSESVYTEFGALVQLSISPGTSFQPRNPPALVRVRETGENLVLSTDGGGVSVLSSAGGIKIGSRRCSVYENETGGVRAFVSDSGELIVVGNAILGVQVVLYDKGDTRRRRAATGLGKGVSFPDVSSVVRWSLSRPPRIDPGALALAGGGSFGGGFVGGSQLCIICHGTGRCTVCKGTGTYRNYGQAVPCDPKCSACNGTGKR